MLQAVYGCCSVVVTFPPLYDVTLLPKLSTFCSLSPKVWILRQPSFSPVEIAPVKVFLPKVNLTSAAISWFTKLDLKIKIFRVAEWDQFLLSLKHAAINQILPRLNLLLGFTFHENGSKHNMTLELEDENGNEDSDKSFRQDCVINWFFVSCLLTEG